MGNIGYLVDLQSIKFSDGLTSEIQIFPYGKYDHPVYGEVSFSPETAGEIIQNFDKNVRGTEIDIDYDHKIHDGLAAGWVRSLVAKSEGLFATIEWTKKAWGHIKSGEYKYFSPELADEWKHPKTGEVIKNVLFGGGITNRPFLKDILPLNMSELGMPSEHQQEGKGMDLEKLRKLLGLSDDATEEQINTALGESIQKAEDDAAAAETAKKDKEKADKEKADADAAAAADDSELVKLSETNPAVKSLVEQVGRLSSQLSDTQSTLRRNEITTQVQKLTETGNALPASSVDGLTKVLTETDPKTANQIVSLLESLQKTGLVALGESGDTKNKGESKDIAKAFNDKITEVMTKDKLSYGDASERVASLEPELYQEYVEQAYSFQES